MFRLTFVVSVFFVLGVSSSYAHQDTNEPLHHHHTINHSHDNYENHTHASGPNHAHEDALHQNDPRVGIPHYNPHGWSFSHAGIQRQQIKPGEGVQGVSERETPGPQTETQPGSNPQVDQQPVIQLTGPQPTAVEESETFQGVSSPQPAGPIAIGSAPQERRPTSPPMQPLRVTEYMIRDWSKGGVKIGNGNLPQWIELHNPNIEAVNLKGWTFQYATRRFRNQPYKVHTLTLAATEDGFSIQGDGVAILSTQKLREGKFSGIEATQVYNLNIENVLKSGWVLTDADGKEVQRIGKDAFSALRDPVAPRHQDGARVSYQVYRSESPSEPYYYGDSRDIGSPGFFYAQSAPAAPMQPLRVTEYMIRDWSKGGVRIGNGNLPQWIELHNPNIEAVNLKGWTFQYATRRFRNQPYKVHTLTLAATEDRFSIPGDGVAILSTQQPHEGKFSGIEATQVYNLNIENVLKSGWVLTDADGKEVQRIGKDAFSALRDPIAPRHQNGARVSYQVYRSESPSEPYYYGDSGDIGSPGFYKSPPPAAPSLVRPKRIGTWARLKQTP